MQDYTHILAHREGQIKTNEARLGALVAQNEALTATVAERDATVAALSATVAEYGERLTDAASVLEDKERLEAQVIKQIELINRQTGELENVKGVLAEREAALAAATERGVELAMRASVTKEHRIIFDDPWIVETTHHRCKGDAPLDREGQLLLSLPGARRSVGFHRSRLWCCGTAGAGTRALQASWCWWAGRAGTRRWAETCGAWTSLPCTGSSRRVHSSIGAPFRRRAPTSGARRCVTARVYGRGEASRRSEERWRGGVQMLVHGGYRNDEITGACSVLNTDQWKWFQPRTRGEQTAPAPRTGHCLVAIRESIFLFGGLTEAGLSSELWVLDLDSLTWAQVRALPPFQHASRGWRRVGQPAAARMVQVPTFGVVPSARKGASAVASENGRKIYLFGGRDESGRTLADVHVLDMERFSWAAIGMLGAAPEGREGAAVSLLGSFMIVVGGTALLEGGARKPVTDAWVAHLVKYAPAASACTRCIRRAGPCEACASAAGRAGSQSATAAPRQVRWASRRSRPAASTAWCTTSASSRCARTATSCSASCRSRRSRCRSTWTGSARQRRRRRSSTCLSSARNPWRGPRRSRCVGTASRSTAPRHTIAHVCRIRRSTPIGLSSCSS